MSYFVLKSKTNLSIQYDDFVKLFTVLPHRLLVIYMPPKELYKQGSELQSIP